jgi:hypothetical protein
MNGELVARALALIGTVQPANSLVCGNLAHTQGVASESTHESAFLKRLSEQVGKSIVWDSPLFGELSGELLAVHTDGLIDVFHPLKEGVARIPKAWVKQTK